MSNIYNIMPKKFLLIAIVLLPATLLAQDFNKAMKQMREVYDQSTQLHAVMEITVYESEEADQPYYFEKAEILRDKELYSYKLTGSEMLMSNTLFILINKDTKEITVSPRDRKNELILKQQMSFDLDSILGLYKPEYLGIKEQQLDHYRLYQESGPIKRVELFVSRANNHLKKLHYYYETGQFVTIEFKTLDLKPRIEKGIFEEKRIFIRMNGKLKGVGKYSDYNVYEQG